MGARMTIDERLEKLTERHEALAQSMELMQRQWEDRWSNITAGFQQIHHTIHQINDALQQDAENIRGLARIAEIHEHRISHLEDKDQ